MILKPSKPPRPGSKFSIANKFFVLAVIVMVLRGICFSDWSSLQIIRSFPMSEIGLSCIFVCLIVFNEADPLTDISDVTYDLVRSSRQYITIRCLQSYLFISSFLNFQTLHTFPRMFFFLLHNLSILIW